MYSENEESNSEAVMGRGGCAQRSVLHVNEPKKSGARSTRAHSVAKTHLLNISIESNVL